MSIINPYANVNWGSVQRIESFSHAHCKGEEQFQYSRNSNVRHLAYSNYYPSDPTYPLDDYFDDVPSNKIGCPNAEHHNFINMPGKTHCNGLGSFWSSGKPEGETPIGVNNTYQYAFKNIIENLQYSDGGGVTVNHPVWSELSTAQAIELLDYDSDRVLGIEIYNRSCEQSNNTGYALEMWDEILMTGRRCWGFVVPDHNAKNTIDFRGMNVLLVPEATEHECLKAYRNGVFYGKERQSEMIFDSISFDGSTFRVSSPTATTIKIVIDGVGTDYSVSSKEISIPSSATYCRAEATDGTNKIYTNPIILKPYVPKAKGKQNMGEFISLFMS